MKKLSLKNLKLAANDKLQRNQLKTVFGGIGEDDCGTTRLTFVYNDGRSNWSGLFTVMGGCTSWSQTQCANALANDNGMSNCYYDCCSNGY